MKNWRETLPLIVIRRIFIVIAAGAWFAATPVALSQEEEIFPEPIPSLTSVSIPNDGLYFADVLVRGIPVLQIGGLAEISASERAAIVNRRIASILAQYDNPGQVTVQPDKPRNIATLQLRNRVLMTVTQQDAQDFDLDVETLAQNWAVQLNRALDRPPLAIDVGQRLYATVRQLLQNLIDNLPSLVGATIVVIITWGVAKAVRYTAFTWAQQTESDSNTEILIGRLGYGAVWIVGSVISLGVLGLDFGALLGALGLTSVAIGFSLKDVLSNYISGVILLAARPFRINDQVVIGDHEGTITQIQLRAIALQTYDGRLVYIPNQEVFQSSIINNTASPRRRSCIRVGINYAEDIDKAKKVIRDTLENISEVEKEPKPVILVWELAPSTVNLKIRFWVDSRKIGFLAATSTVTQAVKEALEAANIDMPTEIYTLILRDIPAEFKLKQEKNVNRENQNTKSN